MAPQTSVDSNHPRVVRSLRPARVVAALALGAVCLAGCSAGAATGSAGPQADPAAVMNDAQPVLADKNPRFLESVPSTLAPIVTWEVLVSSVQSEEAASLLVRGRGGDGTLLSTAALSYHPDGTVGIATEVDTKAGLDPNTMLGGFFHDAGGTLGSGDVSTESVHVENQGATGGALVSGQVPLTSCQNTLKTSLLNGGGWGFGGLSTVGGALCIFFTEVCLPAAGLAVATVSLFGGAKYLQSCQELPFCATSSDGHYCGGASSNFANAGNGHLYQCSGGHVVSDFACSNGCNTQAALTGVEPIPTWNNGPDMCR